MSNELTYSYNRGAPAFILDAIVAAFANKPAIVRETKIVLGPQRTTDWRYILEALLSPALEVSVQIAPTEPNEVVLQGAGVDWLGRVVHPQTILALQPQSISNNSLVIAEEIARQWPDLRSALRATLAQEISHLLRGGDQELHAFPILNYFDIRPTHFGMPRFEDEMPLDVDGKKVLINTVINNVSILGRYRTGAMRVRDLIAHLNDEINGASVPASVQAAGSELRV